MVSYSCTSFSDTSCSYPATAAIEWMREQQGAAGRLGLVRPGNIFQRARRTGLDARLPAESALGRLCRRAVDRSVQGCHCPGASLRADTAACAFGDIDHPGIDRGDDLDGAMRAGQLAGHRVRALAAGILNDTEVAPYAFLREPLRRPGRARIVVSADFDAGNRGL